MSPTPNTPDNFQDALINSQENANKKPENQTEAIVKGTSEELGSLMNSINVAKNSEQERRDAEIDLSLIEAELGQLNTVEDNNIKDERLSTIKDRIEKAEQSKNERYALTGSLPQKFKNVVENPQSLAHNVAGVMVGIGDTAVATGKVVVALGVDLITLPRDIKNEIWS